MTTVSLDASVCVPDDVVFRELDGEAVILNLQTGVYFGLDAVGTRIWQLCQQHDVLQSVWEALQREFDESADVLQADLLSLLGELSGHGLITIVTSQDRAANSSSHADH
jgi:coenzyme PQQ synthesis protein D (PqqD)